MEAQSLSTCNQCGKKFQRKAHLLRHQQQHSGDRPYSCKFCSKTFKRSDVLRDHFSRCERRGNSAIPSSLERGRKRHACDECSRLKVKCDNNVPCRKCVEFGRKCVKSRPAASASSPEETITQPSTPDTGSDRNSINFLLNCPGDTDFMQEFPKSTTLSPNTKTNDEYSNNMTVAKAFEPVANTAVPPTAYQEYGHLIQAHNIEVLLSNLEFQTFETQTNNWQMPGENMILWSGPGALLIDRSVLERKAYDIREKLRYTAVLQHQPHPPPPELFQAIELITTDNIAAYVKLYFRHWHKHGPMIHEATFNPCTAALPLLMALMSLGGMYSKELEDVKKLKSLLDIIETYIFSTPPINDEYESPSRFYVRRGEDSSPEWRQFQLEELQGAYLMVVLQYWTGNPIARTRVRQQRFPRINAIFHHLEVLTSQHPPMLEIKDQLSFSNWIRKESYIRLASLAVMLDATFGMFNNVPTRFQWLEIDLAFPGDDEFFKTINFHDMLAKSAVPRSRMKIKDAFLVLFSPKESNSSLNILRNEKLTAFDMQILIHILYTYVWQSTFSNPLSFLPGTNVQTLIAPFKLAMANWKIIWDEIRASAPENEWNKLGFQRTAETYYQAVESIVTVFEECEGKFPPIPSDVEKGSHLKRLLSFKKTV